MNDNYKSKHNQVFLGIFLLDFFFPLHLQNDTTTVYHQNVYSACACDEWVKEQSPITACRQQEHIAAPVQTDQTKTTLFQSKVDTIWSLQHG